MGSSHRNRRLSFLALGCPFMVALASAFSACGGESSREIQAKEQASALDSPPPVKPLAAPVNLDGTSWKLVEAPEVLPGQTAVALDDGRILVAGGRVLDGENRTTDEAYLFDPATKTWTTLPRMKGSRALHFALKLRDDGRVLVGGGAKGGSQGDEWLATAELFDPATTTWTQTPDMNYPQLNPSITQFLDGRVLLTGGSTNGSGPTPAAQVFDPKSAPAGRWIESSWLPAERENHAVALLPDGTALVMGGWSASELSTQTVYGHRPGGVFGWRALPNLGTARASHTATVLEDGSVLVVGGIETVYYDDTRFDLIPTANVEIHDGQNEASQTASLWIGRSQHAAALLPDGRVIVVGGIGHNGPLDTTEIYDPAYPERGWSPGPSLNAPRYGHSLIATPGRLVVVGGYWALSSTTAFLESLEVLEFGGRLGDPCTAYAECLSGFCTEGVCCNTDCGGTCVACTAALKGHGNDGTCEPVAKGTNPRNACMDEGAASCRMTGTCDGKGACAVYEDGTDCGNGKVCEAGRCGGGFCGEQADGTPCGEADDCTFGLCRERKCVAIHKLDGTRCEGGACIAGECKADRTRTPGGNGGDNGSDDGGSLPDPAGSPSDVGDGGGGGLCSAAPGAPKQMPMAVALALLAGLGAHRRRGKRH